MTDTLESRWRAHGRAGGRMAGLAVAMSLATTIAGACGGQTAGQSGTDAGSDEGTGKDAGGSAVDASIDTGRMDARAEMDVVDAATDCRCSCFDWPLLGTPTFTPPGPATLEAGAQVTIHLPPGQPTGAQVYYTTDGTFPSCSGSTCNGTLYTTPFQVLLVSTMETLRAVTHEPGGCFTDSPPGVAVYTLALPEAGAASDAGGDGG